MENVNYLVIVPESIQIFFFHPSNLIVFRVRPDPKRLDLENQITKTLKFTQILKGMTLGG